MGYRGPDPEPEGQSESAPRLGSDPILLVTGAGGQVGTALRRMIPDARLLARDELDVTDAGAMESAVAGCEAVIHLAAKTKVDRCESEPHEAWNVNAKGTENVVAAAKRHGARLVYVSTDYVFDGRKVGEYSETDVVSPLNVYGRTKLAGERACADYRDHLIVRTSWIFGERENFISKVMARTSECAPRVRVVADQSGRPTYAEDLATALLFLLRSGERGLWHVAGDGPPCSWADLAESALTAAGSEGVVERVSTEDYAASVSHSVAPRPSNSVLRLDKARSFGVPLLDWRASLERYVRRIA